MLSILLNIIKIAFLLGFLILIHEAGHFLVAKVFKVKVKEFAIGFGALIWEILGIETNYVLRAIPLGGFVDLLGEEEASQEEGSYSKASRIKKICILLAGGTVNIIFGLLVYFILVTSTASFVSTTVQQTVENYSAKVAGIEQGDEIIKVNGKKIRLKSKIDSILANGEGKDIKLTVKRNEEILDINLKPSIDEETGRYFLGIIFKEADKSFTNNCYYGFWNTVYFSSSIVENVKELFSGNVGVDQLTGPVGISEVVVKTQNVSQFVYILALISLSLGVTNLLPFPPLDGGKILLLIIEGIIRRPIKENVNNAIQMTGFIIIMALAVIVTYNDVLRIF